MCRRTHACISMYTCAELAIGTQPIGHTGISWPIEIRAPGFDMYSGIGHSAASNGNPIDYPVARFYHTPSICKLIHYNCSVKVAHVRWCMRDFTRGMRGLVVGLVVARYVYEFILRNNPAGSSRDKSFLEFYLVIEFPGVEGVNVNAFARYMERQVTKSQCCNIAVTKPSLTPARKLTVSIIYAMIAKQWMLSEGRIILIFFIIFMTGQSL